MASRTCPLSISKKTRLAIAPHWTYANLDQMANRAAYGLRRQGFKKGDQIALFSHPEGKTISLLFAAWRLSLTATLLPPRLPAAAIQNLIQDLQPIRDPDSLFSEDGDEPSELSLDSLSLLLPTSGSSGAPKWAAFTLGQLFESAETISAALQAKPGDRWLLSLPLHHVGGLGVVLRSLLSQGTLVIEDKNQPYPDRLIQANARYASLVPTQLYRLLKSDCPPLSTHLVIGGAPMPQTLFETAQQRKLTLSLTYGLTEMASSVLLASPTVWIDQIPYLGYPLKGREIKLVKNEIHVRGKSLFAGYGKEAKRTFNDWFPTGDLGVFHEKHGWAVRGRKDFQFTSGGENIQPEEIESAILSHPDVEQAIVVPLFDIEYGARPFAFVQTEISYEKLTGFLSSLLPKFKIPTTFAPMPVDQALKPNRRQLIALVNKKLSLV